MATPSWPVRSLEECERLLTAPGTMHETEVRLIKGQLYTVYKHLPPSLRALWLASKACWTSPLGNGPHDLQQPHV